MDAATKHEAIREAILAAITELTELQRQEDWFCSDSLEGLEEALDLLEPS